MKKILPFLISFVLSSIIMVCKGQLNVITMAGSGTAGKANGTGTAASFNRPFSVAVDASGNVYVADQSNHLIRKITSGEVVSTVAGSGSSGSANGTGTAASFSFPQGVAVDTTSGNIYVADAGNNLIRKITPAGVVSTFAGSGQTGSINGTGTAASFTSPSDVAIDALGNIYVADLGNYIIRKITPGGVVSTFAGSGQQGSANGTGTAASFTQPVGVAVDASGNVYVSDQGTNQIRKITPDGTVTTLAGSGSSGSANGYGATASFYYPIDLAVDASGNVYVADSWNSLIRKITPGGVVSTFAGSGSIGHANGSTATASFYGPQGVTVDAAGNVYVADTDNNLIREITTSSGTTTAIATQTYFSPIQLYPVPTSEQVTVAFTLQQEAIVKLELINSTGNKVTDVGASYETGEHELILSVQCLPAGIYIVNLYIGNQVNSQKVIVTH